MEKFPNSSQGQTSKTRSIEKTPDRAGVIEERKRANKGIIMTI